MCKLNLYAGTIPLIELSHHMMVTLQSHTRSATHDQLSENWP